MQCAAVGELPTCSSIQIRHDCAGVIVVGIPMDLPVSALLFPTSLRMYDRDAGLARTGARSTETGVPEGVVWESVSCRQRREQATTHP